MRFNGSDYDREFDDKRLTDQHLRIKKVMIQGWWKTLSEIAAMTGDPESSVSAQLRHLRKKRFGSYVLEKRPRSDRRNGLFEYRLQPPGTDSDFAVKPRKNRYREALVAIWKHKHMTKEMRTLVQSKLKKD